MSMRRIAESFRLTHAFGDRYEPGSIVPDFDGGASEATPADLECVRLLQIQDDLKNDLAKVPHREGNQFLWELFRASGAESATLLGSRRSPGGRLTTSFDTDSGLLIGIHVDNWFRLPFSEREQSPTRITINVGPDTHWVLFVPEPVRTLLPDMPAASAPHTVDVRAALSRQLDQMHCVALRIEPGNGYVLNTELYPHDGSTFRSAHGSTILTVAIMEQDVGKILNSELCAQCELAPEPYG